jgi:hypothetical protein
MNRGATWTCFAPPVKLKAGAQRKLMCLHANDSAESFAPAGASAVQWPLSSPCVRHLCARHTAKDIQYEVFGPICRCVTPVRPRGSACKERL